MKDARKLVSDLIAYADDNCCGEYGYDQILDVVIEAQIDALRWASGVCKATTMERKEAVECLHTKIRDLRRDVK